MPEGKVFVRDLMSDNVIAIDPEATVAETLARMQQHDIHEMPVMANSTIKGWVSDRVLLRRQGISPEAKVGKVMEQPPRLSKDTDVVEAADLFIRSNVRAVPVTDAKGKVVGILSRTDLLRAIPQISSVAQQALEKVMNRDLETVRESDGIDSAASRLRDLEINQLLVLNDQGRLAGYVGREDVLRLVAAEHSPDAVERNRGHQRGGSKKNRIEVRSAVRPAPSLPPAATVTDAIRLMQQQKTSFIAVVEDGFALGILSRANVIERVARLKPTEGVLVQITGLQSHADSSTLDEIYALAQQTLKKIAGEVNLEFLSLHYKVYKAKTEGDSKYSLTAHLSTEGRFFVQKADDWDPIRAMAAAMGALGRRIREVKELRLERRKGPARRAAEFYTASQP